MTEQRVCPDCDVGLAEIYFKFETNYRCMSCEMITSAKCLLCRKADICSVRTEELGCMLFEGK